jgi:hypothetical protein
MPMAPNAMGTTEIGHWQRTLGRHIWFLRRAGITSARIEREIARCLGQCLNIRELPVPAADERIYPRILAHWQHESAYLDNRGQPRALRFEGHSPTFRSLVRAAVPGADASKALRTLKRYRLVSQSAQGVVRLRADECFPRGVQRGLLLGTTLASLEALTDTCYVNLRAGQPTRPPSRLQRRAYTEHFDRRHLRAYEEFLNESAQVFLAMHESWLKRHEVKRVDPRRICRVGVGVFAIRGH